MLTPDSRTAREGVAMSHLAAAFTAGAADRMTASLRPRTAVVRLAMVVPAQHDQVVVP
jgi:hypothetical protein